MKAQRTPIRLCLFRRRGGLRESHTWYVHAHTGFTFVTPWFSQSLRMGEDVATVVYQVKLRFEGCKSCLIIEMQCLELEIWREIQNAGVKMVSFTAVLNAALQRSF